jgi:broad specificity phosphatase PhoE
MKNRAALRILLSIGLLACRYPAHAQKAVLVVRHGEKVSDTDERLTEAGHARAERLAKMLKDAGVTAIYSTDTERARDTVQPLAAVLGLKVEIYDKSDAQFVERIRREQPGGIGVVAGHSNTIPDLLKALGCPGDFKIASDEYDNLFLVVPKADGPATLLHLRY